MRDDVHPAPSTSGDGTHVGTGVLTRNVHVPVMGLLDGARLVTSVAGTPTRTIA